MANRNENPPPTEQVACSVCKQDIPLSTALMPEGAGYVEHFRGNDCYVEYLSMQDKKAGQQIQKK